MNSKIVSAAFAACVATLVAGPALAECEFKKIADLKVDTRRGPPMVEVGINGKTALMVLNTSSQPNVIYQSSAEMLNLGALDTRGLQVVSAKGERDVRGVAVNDVVIGDAVRLARLEALVQPGPTNTSDVIGSLGLDFLGASDIEFDLKNDRVSLFSAKGCEKQSLGYWTENHTVADMRRQARPRLMTTVVLNGRPMAAQLATGTSTSVVERPAAAGAGVKPGGEGVEVAGPDVWIGTFQTFAIGGEQVKNVKLSFADIYSRITTRETGSNMRQRMENLPDMMLGMDFMKAHRVLVSNSQGKMYISYNGGPIFAKPDPAAAQK